MDPATEGFFFLFLCKNILSTKTTSLLFLVNHVAFALVW